MFNICENLILDIRAKIEYMVVLPTGDGMQANTKTWLMTGYYSLCLVIRDARGARDETNQSTHSRSLTRAILMLIELN